MTYDNDSPQKGPEPMLLPLSGYLGIDTLPQQMVNKLMQTAFPFNVLCIGDTGIGKSTFLQSLFDHEFDSTPSPHDLPNVELNCFIHELQEKHVKLRLSVVETCGYADQINKEDSAKSIVEYVQTQFETYLQEEMRINRAMSTYVDSRIHACFYFIQPSGHSIRSIDIITMRQLHDKVNLILVIGKADSLTPSELVEFKKRILKEISTNEIKCYLFPSLADDSEKITPQIFAVVSATTKIKLPNGKTGRGRQYPWGVVQVDDSTHCDFAKLRDLLLKLHLDDLRETTHYQHYELYRQSRLEQMGFHGDQVSIQEMYESRRIDQQRRQQSQEEEMRLMFLSKVKVKEEHLKESERKVNNQFETVKKQHAEDRKRLEEKKRQLEEELSAFEKKRLLSENARGSPASIPAKRKK